MGAGRPNYTDGATLMGESMLNKPQAFGEGCISENQWCPVITSLHIADAWFVHTFVFGFSRANIFKTIRSEHSGLFGSSTWWRVCGCGVAPMLINPDISTE